jgi:hypothetical protein
MMADKPPGSVVRDPEAATNNRRLANTFRGTNV